MPGGSFHAVLQAGSGEDGLRLMQEHPIDLVVLDVMLPGIDGWEVCRRIREQPQTIDLPVIIFTVRSERLDQDKAERTLANAFVNKPFDREDIVGAVERLLVTYTTTV